jgi:hypothetical protein
MDYRQEDSKEEFYSELSENRDVNNEWILTSSLTALLVLSSTIIMTVRSFQMKISPIYLTTEGLQNVSDYNTAFGYF